MRMFFANSLARFSVLLDEIVENRSIRLGLGTILLTIQRRAFFPRTLSIFLVWFAMQRCNCPTPHSEYHLKPWFEDQGDKSFVDVGAGTGRHSIYMASRCARVYAFEPNPSSCYVLSYRLRRHKNVEVYRVAIGEKDHVGWLHLHHNPAHNSLIKKAPDFSGRKIRIPVRHLDSYQFAVPVGLIKVDVEGYEAQVLSGAKRTIEQHRPRIIAEIHPPYESNREAVSKILSMHGYSLSTIRNPNPRIQVWGHVIATPPERGCEPQDMRGDPPAEQ
ncbi:MAG: FkbM family methyltransferase [Thermoplasmata archaeon]